MEVLVPIAGASGSLPGVLEHADDPAGLVIFAHGSGSSRMSPRNRAVAAALRGAGMSTLLFDLLTEAEAGDRANVFDISLLGRRITGAVDWAGARPGCAFLPVGLFGSSTGAAAALVAAAERPDAVAAVVSRGGRPDLAGARLRDVRCPTLLIVGGADQTVLELNRTALDVLQCRKTLEIVPGATHLFEEPGALDAVVGLAARWFRACFAAGGAPA